MKKLLFIAMMIASVAAKAQTFYDNKLYFIADNSGVEFDFSDNYLLYNWWVDIIEKDNFGDPDIIMNPKLGVVSSVISQNYNSVITINSPIPTQYIPVSNYSITFGKYYKVYYWVPSWFYYRHFFSYPHASMHIKIYVLDSNNEIMATYTVAEIQLNIQFDNTNSCWICWGNMNQSSNVIAPSYDGSALFSVNRLSPTSDFSDLFYDNRPAFMNQIARCVFAVSFRG